MVLNKCLKQQTPQTYLHMIHFYLLDAFQLVQNLQFQEIRIKMFNSS